MLYLAVTNANLLLYHVLLCGRRQDEYDGCYHNQPHQRVELPASAISLPMEAPAIWLSRLSSDDLRYTALGGGPGGLRWIVTRSPVFTCLRSRAEPRLFLESSQLRDLRVIALL